MERIPRDLFPRYFEKAEKEGYFRIVEELRRTLHFIRHDLLTLQSPGHDYGLIVCKNVLLHFNEEQRAKVIRMFYDSLMEGGFLVFEQTQALPGSVAHLFT